MKWRHQESRDRRGETAGNGNPAPFPASDVIMQCDVTGNDLAEDEEEELVMDDDDDEEEADSTADREISSTRLWQLGQLRAEEADSLGSWHQC